LGWVGTESVVSWLAKSLISREISSWRWLRAQLQVLGGRRGVGSRRHREVARHVLGQHLDAIDDAVLSVRDADRIEEPIDGRLAAEHGSHETRQARGPVGRVDALESHVEVRSLEELERPQHLQHGSRAHETQIHRQRAFAAAIRHAHGALGLHGGNDQPHAIVDAARGQEPMQLVSVVG